MIKYYIRKLKCRLGYHDYDFVPVIACLDSYWMQGGNECTVCKPKEISYNDASNLILSAYDRGVHNTRNSLLAYSNGIDDMVKLYGKEYVQKRLDKL